MKLYISRKKNNIDPGRVTAENNGIGQAAIFHIWMDHIESKENFL